MRFGFNEARLIVHSATEEGAWVYMFHYPRVRLNAHVYVYAFIFFLNKQRCHLKLHVCSRSHGKCYCIAIFLALRPECVSEGCDLFYVK